MFNSHLKECELLENGFQSYFALELTLKINVI